MLKETKAKYGALEHDGVTVGSELAHLCATYHQPIEYFLNLLSENEYLFEYYLYHMPEIRGYQNGQLAQLEATILNALGGKSDSGKATPPHKMYNLHERLVYYASLGEKIRLSPRAAKAIKENTSKIPSWAIDLIDWNHISAS